MKKIVVIGGGTGTFTVLSGLRDYPFELSAIVSTADNGGSTGILRDELGVLPPGDIRQALVALSQDSNTMRRLFNYRFEEGSLSGHSFGNLFLSALEKVTGSFDRAVLEAGRVLAIRGSVIPVTTSSVHLQAEDEAGERICGEHQIEEYIWQERSRIGRFWLEPECILHPLAKLAIARADLIIIAPGSLFTSLIPNLLVPGMREALQQAKAQMVYVVNLMTEKGQAGSFFVQDFVDQVEAYLGSGRINYVVYNTRLPKPELLLRYKKEKERLPVRLDPRRKRDLSYRLLGASLINRQPATPPTAADPLAASRTLIRHDPEKLARILYPLSVLKDMQKYLK